MAEYEAASEEEAKYVRLFQENGYSIKVKVRTPLGSRFALYPGWPKVVKARAKKNGHKFKARMEIGRPEGYRETSEDKIEAARVKALRILAAMTGLDDDYDKMALRDQIYRELG